MLFVRVDHSLKANDHVLLHLYSEGLWHRRYLMQVLVVRKQ